MSKLLSLPDELLLNVIKHVSPNDIENFSMICKYIHSLSEDVLSEHAAHKQRYSRLTLSTLDATDWDLKAKHPLFVLRDILQNDRVAFYPTEVVIRDSDDHRDATQPWDYPESFEDEVVRFLAQYDDEILSLLSNCPYLVGPEVAEWHSRIKHRIDGASVAFLLTILPNVEKITVNHYLFDNASLREMIHKISRVNYNRPSGERQPIALSKVLDVTLDDIDRLMNLAHERKDLGLLGLFSGLPSIQSIHGRRLDGRAFQRYQRLDSTFVPYSPSLREVHFTSSSISLDVLGQLLCNIKTLQRFSYSHDGVGVTPHLRRIVALLQTHARSSLVELEVTGISWSSDNFLFASLVKPMRQFEVLERIRVDAEIFMKNRNTPCEPEPPSRVLSTSVKVLELAREINREDASLLFAVLFSPKKKVLPNLRKIVFQRWMRLSRTIRAQCKEAGISLEVVHQV
ncbi:hypothetical protein MMC22_008899 [Lobaria immixta]|nr:hypothetical protein [Lobaria immixta]